MKNLLLTLAAVSALAAGCATDATTSSGEELSERVYRTGSNIPTKQKSGPSGEGLSTYDREALSRARDEAYRPPTRATGSP